MSSDIVSTIFFAWVGSIKNLEYNSGIVTSIMIPLVVLTNMLISPQSMQIAKYSGVVIMNITTIGYILIQVIFYIVSLDGDMSSVERILEFTEID